MGQNDYLLKDLQVIDGTGSPAFNADILIQANQITGLGRFSPNDAKRVIYCEGLTAAPGFIDIHNHSDIGIFSHPEARNYTTQGCTTLVCGNCGISAAPFHKDYFEISGFEYDVSDCHPPNWRSFADYMKDLIQLEKAVNIASYIGHGNIRGQVLGLENVQPTSEQLESMKKITHEAMASGAAGVSSGLIFDPGIFAKMEELITICSVVVPFSGVYASHIRNESDFLIDAVMEAIHIGRESGVRVQISHLKTSGKRNFGLDKTVLELMEYYRRFGIEVTSDTYPCIYGQTGLENCMPAWTRESGKEGLIDILKNPEKRNRVRSELSRPSLDWENILLDAGFDETYLAETKRFKEYRGKSLSEISDLMKKDAYDVVFDLVQEEPEVSVLVGGLGEADMEMVLSHDLNITCSDSEVVGLNEGMPHPRTYRAFTRAMTTYARDRKLFTLENAIRKMTSMPAWKLGMYDRGIIRPGMKADLALFDYWELKYHAEYGDPHHYSTGMHHVFVNGKPVIENKEFTMNKPGMVVPMNR